MGLGSTYRHLWATPSLSQLPLLRRRLPTTVPVGKALRLQAGGSSPLGGGVWWSMEGGRQRCNRLAAACWEKKLEHVLAAQIQKDNPNFSILAIKV